MNIDWSKAPEGAIGFAMPTQAWENPIWYKKNDSGDLVFTVAGKPEAWQASCLVPDRVVWRDDCERWTGEGLPPVGEKVEAAIPHVSGDNNEVKSIIWVEGSVIAYFECGGKTYSWFESEGGFYPPNVLEFRPLRTPEQIAAEEREREIEALSDHIEELLMAYEAKNYYGIAKSLHLAGYRKQDAQK